MSENKLDRIALGEELATDGFAGAIEDGVDAAWTDGEAAQTMRDALGLDGEDGLASDRAVVPVMPPTLSGAVELDPVEQ